MEIGKPQTCAGQRIEMRGIDFATECTHVGKAPVVGYQHHEIGTLGRRTRGRRRWGARARCGIGRYRKRQHAHKAIRLRRTPGHCVIDIPTISFLHCIAL